MPRRTERASFTDHCALAFLSALAAFVVGALLWLCAALISATFFSGWSPAFAWVWMFTGVMSLLGFLLMENYVFLVLEWLWARLSQLWAVLWHLIVT